MEGIALLGLQVALRCESYHKFNPLEASETTFLIEAELPISEAAVLKRNHSFIAKLWIAFTEPDFLHQAEEHKFTDTHDSLHL